MSFFDKLKDVTYIDGFMQFLHRGSNEIFVVSVIKISAFNKMCLTVTVTGHWQVVHSGWSARNNR